jgi:hypothetical protein
MNDTIEEQRKKRLQFMQAAYKLAEQNTMTPISSVQIGATLGFDPPESLNIARYLAGEGLLKGIANGVYVVTHQGFVEIEKALSKPDTPTEHFPPAMNVIVDFSPRA